MRRIRGDDLRFVVREVCRRRGPAVTLCGWVRRGPIWSSDVFDVVHRQIREINAEGLPTKGICIPRAQAWLRVVRMYFQDELVRELKQGWQCTLHLCGPGWDLVRKGDVLGGIKANSEKLWDAHQEIGQSDGG